MNSFDIMHAVVFRKIFAFDREASRLSTMRALLKKTGADCVSTTHKDFLRVDPHDPKYKEVKYILVDPSCSGSGETNNEHVYSHKAAQKKGKKKAQKNSNIQPSLHIYQTSMSS